MIFIFILVAVFSAALAIYGAFHVYQQLSDSALQANPNQTLYFWLSFTSTALTSGGAFLSAIQAATKNPATATRTAIIVAALTFCSALANSLATHYHDQSTTGGSRQRIPS